MNTFSHPARHAAPCAQLFTTVITTVVDLTDTWRPPRCSCNGHTANHHNTHSTTQISFPDRERCATYPFARVAQGLRAVFVARAVYSTSLVSIARLLYPSDPLPPPHRSVRAMPPRQSPPSSDASGRGEQRPTLPPIRQIFGRTYNKLLVLFLGLTRVYHQRNCHGLFHLTRLDRHRPPT